MSAVVVSLPARGPQVEARYTRLANDLLDALVRAGLTARQWAVVMAIVRKTYGFNKQEDDIGLGQLHTMTGIDKGHLSRTVRELAAAKVITRQEGVHGHTLGINKDWSSWGLPNQQRLLKEQPPVAESATRSVAERATPGVAESATTKDNLPKDNHQKTIPKDKTLCAPQADRGEAGDGRADHKGRAVTPLNATLQDRFDRFYAAYPRKRSRIAAEKAFAKLNPSEQLLGTMLVAIERAKTSDQWCKGMIPHPSSWLAAGAWMDDVETEYTDAERAVIEAFNVELGDVAGVLDASIYVESRAHAIRDLLARRPSDPDFWRRYFPWVRVNVDLPPHTGFDWLISREGFTKVTSGQHNKAP